MAFLNAAKTYKRETAWALLAFICALAANAVFADIFKYEAENTLAVLGVLVIPFITFAMAAFGFDAWAKQVNQNNDIRPAEFNYENEERGE